jgi:NitT/TauT family transport system substrate-binding protein
LRAAIFVTALVPAANAFAGDRLTVIVGGIEKQIYLPAKLAESLGYFEDAGLDVKLVNAETGIEAQNELLTGAAQAAVGFYDHTIALQARGYYVVALVQFGQAPGEVELVSNRFAKQINSPADLRGHLLGVAGLGSSTDFLTRYIAFLSGLKFGEYKLVPTEAGNSFIRAMQQGEIAAGMTTEPTAGRLLKDGGAKILVDLRTPEATRAAFGGCYPGAALYVHSDWLAMHRALAERLVAAFVRAMRYMATHSAAEIAENLPNAYFEGDKAFYVERLAEGKPMFTLDGRMPEGCPESALKTLSSISRSLQDKQIDLAKTYTNALVDTAVTTLDQAKDDTKGIEPVDRRELPVNGP